MFVGRTMSFVFFWAIIVSICMSGVLILVGLVALAGLSVALSKLSEKRRAKDLAAAANRLGFSYQKKVDPMAVMPSGSFVLFRKGDSRSCANVMWQKVDGFAVTHFDFLYTVGFNNSARDCSQTVTMFQTSRLNFPGFFLTSKGFFEKIDDALRGNSINFTDFAIFSKSYLLRSENEERIRWLFSEDILHFFEAHLGYTVEAWQNTLIVYHPGQLLRPKDLERELVGRREIFEALRGRAKPG